MSQLGSRAPTASRNAAMPAVALAGVSLILFLLAVTGIYEATWVYVVSLLAGILAVGVGLQVRGRAAPATARMATYAAAVGGVLAVLQLGWIVLAALGVIEDTS